MKKPPNLIIREIFKREFIEQRHIKKADLLDWFTNSDHLEKFTQEERVNGFNFLVIDGCIAVQDEYTIWNSYGPKPKNNCSSIDADSIGNVPHCHHGHSGASKMWFHIAHSK